MAKAKEVAAYEVPALVITPDQPVEVTGNYAAIEKTLQQWKSSVSKMDLTEDNLDQVTAVKKAAVAVRNNLDRVVAATKKALFNDPKAIFEARVKTLYSLVADVEGSADAVLGELEKNRLKEVNEVLDHYKAEAQKQYALEESYLAQVEYPKDFYNKTVPKGYSSMDKYWKESLDARFKELKKEQDAHAAAVRLVEASCEGEKRLNVQHWVGQLRYDDVATVVESIKAEKDRLRRLDEEQTTAGTTSTSEVVEAEVVDAAEHATEETSKVILGIPVTLNFNTDFPGRTSSKKLEIIYPCDLGDTLTELFKLLKPYGIKVKTLEAVF